MSVFLNFLSAPVVIVRDAHRQIISVIVRRIPCLQTMSARHDDAIIWRDSGQTEDTVRHDAMMLVWASTIVIYNE